MVNRKTRSKWRLHESSIWYFATRLSPRRPPPAIFSHVLMVIVAAVLLLTAATHLFAWL